MHFSTAVQCVHTTLFHQSYSDRQPKDFDEIDQNGNSLSLHMQSLREPRAHEILYFKNISV